MIKSLINWLMHRMMRGQAKNLAKWATESYRSLKSQNPEASDRETFAKLLDLRGSFPGGEKDRDIILNRYGSSLNGLCYYIGLNSQAMKAQMVSRCIQFTEYIDIELEQQGFHKPSNDIKRNYFKTLGLPESAAEERHL